MIFGLAFHVLLLADRGMLDVLSAQRRILLVIVAFRFLMMIHAQITTNEQDKAEPKPRYTDWRAAVLPLLFATPPFIVFWLVWWSVGNTLPNLAEYTIVVTIIMLVLVVNFLFVWLKSILRPAPTHEAVQPQPGAGEFGLDCLFFMTYSLVLALGIIGLMIYAPEFLDDITAIGRHTFFNFVFILALQFAFEILSSLVRRDDKATSGQVSPEKLGRQQVTPRA